MIASIDVAMGGRAAEELKFGNKEISTGYYLFNKLKCCLLCALQVVAMICKKLQKWHMHM